MNSMERPTERDYNNDKNENYIVSDIVDIGHGRDNNEYEPGWNHRLKKGVI